MVYAKVYSCINARTAAISSVQEVEVSENELWNAYQQKKQTIKELSERFGMSVATIKRRLHDIKREWVQPPLSGEGFVHLDVTYWGRSFGV